MRGVLLFGARRLRNCKKILSNRKQLYMSCTMPAYMWCSVQILCFDSINRSTEEESEVLLKF